MGIVKKQVAIVRVSLAASLSFFVLSLAPAAFAQDDTAEDKKESAAEDGANIELDLSKKLSGKDGIDFVCEADIYYSWKRKASKPSKKGTPVSPQKEIDTFFTTVGSRGLIGEDVRNRLTAKIPRIRSQAREHCERTHQDPAKCVAAELRSNAEDYNIMDFKSRAAFLEAVQENCAENTGVCTTTKTRPITCYLNRPPGVPLADEAEEGEEGKDGKKKKK